MKRNTLTTAVLAGLTGVAGMASVANAVNVNPDGLGQVLLYPYYSARGGNDTIVSIVNTSDRAKAVKIRFIEALNSREVLDFNIYMSPFDVWAAGITEDAAGGAKLLFSDNTCTAPYLLETTGGEQPFLSAAYVGSETDGGPTGLDRTRSGYVEVIEMGELAEGSAPETAATHVAGTPPPSGIAGAPCALFTEWFISSNFANGSGQWGPATNNPGFEGANFELDPPAGGLFGSASMINVSQGTMVTYNATAIDGFFNDTTAQHTNPGDLSPSLAEGNVAVSNTFVNGQVSTAQWVAPIFALNAALTFETLMNEYAVEETLGGNSEWIVTFPTKRFHVDAPGEGLSEPFPPFTNLWTIDDPYACEELDLAVWNREEQTPDPATGGIVVSPQVPGETPVFELCREANVIRFANDDSLPDTAEITGEPSSDVASRPEYGYVNFGVPFQSGWARFDFGGFSSTPTVASTAPGAAPADLQIAGLPVVGFWANTFTNGNVASGVLSNYGGSFQHRGSRSIPQSGD